MARPIPTAKPSVNLASNPASSGPRVSRIRRDPPPVVKEKIVSLEEHDEWTVVVGVLAFALAIFFLIIAFSGYSGRSAAGYTVEVKVAD